MNANIFSLDLFILKLIINDWINYKNKIYKKKENNKIYNFIYSNLYILMYQNANYLTYKKIKLSCTMNM